MGHYPEKKKKVEVLVALEGPVDRPGGNYARMQADFRDGRFFFLRATCAKFDLFILVPLFKLCRVVWSL